MQAFGNPYSSSARLPVFRIAPAVEAGNYQNSVLLHLEEDSLWKPPDTRAAPPSMYNRKLQWMFGDRFNRSLYRTGKAFS